jgi:purine-binding chemotaxis protein CheW
VNLKMNQVKIHHQLQYITFRLDHNLIGINIREIREIVPKFKITRVQKSPDFILGLMNLRGQILTIFDIGVFLGLEKRQVSKQSHIIIFKHKDVGFIVDQIGDLVSAKEKSIESIPANIESEIQKYMENIVNLPDELLMILNAEKILVSTQKASQSPKEIL